MSTPVTEEPGGPAVAGAPHAGPEAARVGWTRADVLALATLAVVLAVHLPFPFTGDQALFTHAAGGITRGDRIYLDFWDLKQPGIYYWFAGAGRILGSGEVGIHLAELLWALAAARVVQVVAARAVTRRLLASWAPLATLGSLYAVARPWDLTQVELLVGLPLLALVALAARDDLDPSRALLAGAALGAVAYLKLLYVPIALAIIGVQLLRNPRRGRIVAGVTAGFAITIAPFAWYVAREGLGSELWWAWVRYPSRISSIDPRPLGRLRESLTFMVRMFVWLAPLVALAALRPRWAPGPRPPARGRVSAALWVWLLGGAALVLMQQWWGYHFMLLVPPFALLAVLGADELLAHAGRRVVVGTLAVTTALALLPASELAHKGVVLAEHGLALGDDARLDFQRSWHPEYATVDTELGFVEHPDALPGPMHVMGDPLLLQRSGREAAIALNGWSPELWDERLWARNREQLAEALAGGRLAYLWVDRVNAALWRRRSPATWEWMRRTFVPAATIEDGTWYVPAGTPFPTRRGHEGHRRT